MPQRELLDGASEERPVAGCRSGDDANAKVFPQLLEEHEGEHRVRNQADTCRDETLQREKRCWISGRDFSSG